MPRLASFIVLISVGVLAGAQLAHGAGLTDRDTKYLTASFGPSVQNDIIKYMSPEEQAKLHDTINARFANDVPELRIHIVADYLFTVHMRQCQAWAIGHSGELCPPPPDLSVLPGKNVADQQCNACHLFGTARAPAFRTLAKSDKSNPEYLASAIRAGHQMSPMYLSAEQVTALSAYIKSLK